MAKITYEIKNLSSATMDVIDQANKIITIYQEQGYSLTLRQLYYQFVARALIPNTERSYKRIGNIISDGRRCGLIDWEAIEDRTRQLRKNSAWTSPQSILQSARDSYHKDLWQNQDYRLEVWIEKDALIGVIEGICTELDVPYFSCRGYVSDSEMWTAAVRMRAWASKYGQKVVLLHLGDHDPSGIDMTRDIESRIDLFSLGYPGITIRRIALTMDQIEEQGPPPNPAKVTDSRYEGYRKLYGDESYELDALEPLFITELIRDHVDEFRDPDRWYEAVSEQEDDRERIGRVIENWNALDFD